MNIKFDNFLSFKLRKLILFLFIFSNELAFASENLKKSNIVSSPKLVDNKIKEYEIKSNYLLDSGDSLFIQFSGLEIFNNVYKVDLNGNLSLPEIGKINVSKRSISETKKLLLNKYSDFIVDPEIDITIVIYRPINVVITGEVNKSGLFTLNMAEIYTPNIDLISQNNNNNNLELNNTNSLAKKKFFAPRVFDALKLSNGLSNNADLSSVEIIRNNSISQGGGKIRTKIDLLSLIQNGDQTQNIRIYDGDIIRIPKSKKVLKEQILTINRSNLTPDLITVFVSGNVLSPGALALKQGTNLVQAVNVAGGENYFTGKVNFMRIDNQGNTNKKTFNYNPNAENNSAQNPILVEGDIINLRKNILGSITTSVANISDPILRGYGLYSLFD
tara:strand:+ start:896 stop:2056 length:1161 start_codon:yes stop_codon:yes gene_type:complete